MATQVEKPVSDYMAEKEAARAIHPWPEVFALLEIVPDGGLESMPEDDQCWVCWQLAKLVAETWPGQGSLYFQFDITKKLLGTGRASNDTWFRMMLGVMGVMMMTPEEVARNWGE